MIENKTYYVTRTRTDGSKIKQKVTILSEPDNSGRVRYQKEWDEDNPAYCRTCGKSSEMECSCYEQNKIVGQIFLGIPPVPE